MKKTPSFIELEQLALVANRFKYPLLPESARYIGKYTDKAANGLTNCVIEFLLSGFIFFYSIYKIKNICYGQ